MNEKKRIERVKKSKLVPKEISKLYELNIIESLKNKGYLTDEETIEAYEKRIKMSSADSKKKGGKANGLLLFITKKS